MEILLILLFLWFLPVVVLCAMADSKGRSKHFGWWAVFLGWLGFVIAAIMIAAGVPGAIDRWGAMLVSAPGPSLYEELLQGLAAAELPYEALSPAVRADIEAESWAVFQRPSQSLMWGADWRIRAWITGRGFGKNRSAAEGMIQAADEHGVRHMAAIGQTFTDVVGADAAGPEGGVATALGGSGPVGADRPGAILVGVAIRPRARRSLLG